MAGVDHETSGLLKMLKEGYQILVVYFHRVATLAADKMVVIMDGGFIHHPPTADMRDEGQTLADEEIEGAVDGCFGDAGEALHRELVDGARAEVAAAFIQDLEDDQALGCETEAMVAKAVEGKGWVQLVIPAIAKSINKDYIRIYFLFK
jgi:hypothetical protein